MIGENLDLFDRVVNERYQAFLDTQGNRPLYDYQAFIVRLRNVCGKSDSLAVHERQGRFGGGCSIIDQDLFTKFVQDNAHRVTFNSEFPWIVEFN